MKLENLENIKLENIADLIIAFDLLEIHGTIALFRLDEHRIVVRHNGEHFGIWDAQRQTFVD